MYPSLVLSAALIAPAAPLPRDAAPAQTGPAPLVLSLKADTGGAVRIVGNIPTKVTVTNTYVTIEQVVVDGKPVQRQVQKQVDQDIVTQQYFNKTLADCKGTFATADGKPLTVDEATNRVKAGAPVLVSSDGKPIARSWLRAVSPDTVVMVADGLEKVQPQWGGAPWPTTPAPRLAMLGTDDTGKVLTSCTSAPNNPNGVVYYDDLMAVQGGFGRGKMIRGDIAWGGDYGYGGHNPSAKVVTKPLAEVKFDAYDRTGKLVSRTETLKRLAAGGMVVVAGDTRMPDDAYLKCLRDDVLVLVSPELVLPVTPVDQTKKKDDKAKPADQPAPPVQVRPLPVKIAPAVIKGRAIGGAVAPAVEAKPAKEVKEEKK
jgi:hypothetical protein